MDHAETSIFPDNQSTIDQNGIPIQKVGVRSSLLLLLWVRTESIYLTIKCSNSFSYVNFFSPKEDTVTFFKFIQF